jgi:hypothetical protein
MADVKISGLPASTTPLAGTEVLPIVQSGTTKQVSVANLTAGRTVSAENLNVTSQLGIGTTSPTVNQAIDAVINVNALTGIRIANANAGAAAGVSTSYSNGTTTASFGVIGTGYTTYGVLAPSTTYIYAGGSYNLALSADGSTGRITFGTGNGISEKMRIHASGGVSIGNTTDPGAGVLFVSSGVRFPATQSASADVNTLDDYEEGTFTPTVIGTTSAGTAIYLGQSGVYTKVGRQVTVNVYVQYNSGTGTGKLKLAGLPFTSSATNLSACSVGVFSNIAMTANHFPTVFVGSSTTEVTFWSTPVGGGGNAIIDYDDAGEILVSATYFV